MSFIFQNGYGPVGGGLFVDKQSRGSCRSATLQLDKFIFSFYCTLYKYSMYSARHVSRTYVTFYSLAAKRTNKSHTRTLATSFAIALSLSHLCSSALSVRHRNWFWGMNIPPARFTDWFRRKMGSNFSTLATFVEFSIPIFFAGRETKRDDYSNVQIGELWTWQRMARIWSIFETKCQVLAYFLLSHFYFRRQACQAEISVIEKLNMYNITVNQIKLNQIYLLYFYYESLRFNFRE